MPNYVLSIIVIVLILLVFYSSSAPTCGSVWLDDYYDRFKTGDLICFKATNNYNSLMMLNYFTHVGIVVLIGRVPYIFEAFEVSGYKWKDDRHKNGILFTPLYERVVRYKGFAYVKPLEFALESHVLNEFNSFINFALSEMKYNYSIVSNCFSKLFGQDYATGTNCAELVALSFVKLGLLDMQDIKHIFNHIKFVTNITEVKNNRYLEPQELLYESVV